ncbi:MAG TPA: hypothetical protein VMD97_10480 [Candidatus Aquilonibacter sp.]|nr:hypothetical protein [Candidatus Aquilonibacter sp.]
MSSRQAVVLASRVLCVYFLYAAFGTLLSLPLMIFQTRQAWHMIQNSQFTPSNFFTTTMILSGAAILRLAVELLLAVAFYRSVPRVVAFLTAETASSEFAENSPAN